MYLHLFWILSNSTKGSLHSSLRETGKIPAEVAKNAAATSFIFHAMSSIISFTRSAGEERRYISNSFLSFLVKKIPGVPWRNPCAPFTGSQGDAGHTRDARWHAGSWGLMCLLILNSSHPAYIKSLSSTALLRKSLSGMNLPGYSADILLFQAILSSPGLMPHRKALPGGAPLPPQLPGAPVLAYNPLQGAQNEPRSWSLKTLHPSIPGMPQECTPGF